MKTVENTTRIIGEIISEPVLCHTSHDESFYSFNVKTSRKSDNYDSVPVLISEKLMKDIEVGKHVDITGQIRTYNKIENDNKRLLIFVFVMNIKEITQEECESETVANNEILLRGFICKEPIYRKTPFGREITDLLLAVNRSYHKSDYIPCIAWGRNAIYCSNFEVGTKLEITGRLQSREYVKKLADGTSVTKIAYEVSIINVKTTETEN